MVENTTGGGPFGLRLSEGLGVTLAACRPAFEGLADAMRGVTKAAYAFADAWYLTAERAYLLEHPRLPGGTRTPRLRKKRRSVVLARYARRLGGR